MYNNLQVSGFDAANNSGHLNSQPLLSRSQSRLQSSMQKIDSHIKSTLPFLKGHSQKKYIYFKYHKYFGQHKIEGFRQLLGLLHEHFEDRISFKQFSDRKELLKDNYHDNQLHYIIVPMFDLDWASTFAKQEREENNSLTKVNIYVYGILKKKEYEEKMKARSKKRIDATSEYVDYFYYDELDYPQKIVNAVENHLDVRLRQENQHIKTWALTNKYAGKKIKKRTLHFFYQESMQNQFKGIYKTYKKKSKSSWLQTYPFRAFEDILRKIRQREVAYTKEVDVARKATSKIMDSQLLMQPVSMRSGMKSQVMRSGVFDGMSNIGSQMNSTVINSSLKTLYKMGKDDLNIIICNGGHAQIQKMRTFVRAQKLNNWYLWQIHQKNPQVISRLKDFLQQQARNNQILQQQQNQRILHCKHLLIMAHVNDETTYNIFQNQRNVFNHMQLILYNDPDEFSLFLREGINSIDNFTIAVVPGGFRSFQAEYAKVINQFVATYRNGDQVENFKFISSAAGKYGSSNVFPTSSGLLGTGQSSMTDIKGIRFQQDLQRLMRQRDRLFHPFQGLTGKNVYLLIQQSIVDKLNDLQPYIAQTSRLKVKTYMDKQWLRLSLQTLTIKDSVIVITDDYTLRQAQHVLKDFENVFILNITTRENPKTQQNVISSGNQQHIYDLIKTINPQASFIEDQLYAEMGQTYNLTRKNRMMPKDLHFKPGNKLSVRLPANLKDQQSQKMQNRLHKYFYGQINIQYYKHPRQIRILNKSQQPLSFIIWAYNSTWSQKKKQQALGQLQFLKQLARHEDQQLRQEYLIYSDMPLEFKDLVQDDKYSRFKFISNKWEKIEEYIIGHMRPSNYDSIYSDQTAVVFYNEKDMSYREATELINSRCDQNKFNPANHIQFQDIEDLIKILDEHNPLSKFYILFNEDTSPIPLRQLQQTIKQPQYFNHYIRILLINNSHSHGSKKLDKSNSAIRGTFTSYRDSGQWLLNLQVLQAGYNCITPHVIIDYGTMNYYYFLDKYSEITEKFSYQYLERKEEIKRVVEERKGREKDQIWVIVKDSKTMYQYIKLVQKTQIYKKGGIRFIIEGSEQVHNNVSNKVVFQHIQKRQIQKFLLNIYRRDNKIFFPSSLGTINSVALAVIRPSPAHKLVISQQQIGRWQNILKAQIYNLTSIQQLIQLVQNNPYHIFYVICPYSMRQQMLNTFYRNDNIKKIYYATNKEYNHRQLDQTKIVQDRNQIYIGTYSKEISQYLKYLRYNIRKSQNMLQKEMTSELIQIYLQEQYKLTPFEVQVLTTKNDSLIINKNGYKVTQLPQLLKNTNNFNHLHIFVGDDLSGKLVTQFMNKNKRDNIKFIDMKTSDLSIAKGVSRHRHHSLETNDRRQMLTYLFNIPQNRYMKALNHRGKYNLHVNPKNVGIYTYYQLLDKIKTRNPNIQVTTYTKLTPKDLTEPTRVLLHSQSERQTMQTLSNKDIYYITVSQAPRQDKSYSANGNRQFMGRKGVQFKHFMNQIPTGGYNVIQPVRVWIDDGVEMIERIAGFGSAPVDIGVSQIKTSSPFLPMPLDSVELMPLQTVQGMIDDHPASLGDTSGIWLKADVPALPLGLQVLQRIKANLKPLVDGNILNPGLDASCAHQLTSISSSPDSFAGIIMPIPKPPPATPILKQKLAILHPNTDQFHQISAMLKSNLEPQQFAVVNNIPYKNQIDLQEYSKGNAQKLNGYDKIVVFLWEKYRKYEPILRTMKGKLGGRMEYFIFDDNFHIENHGKLKHHLRPYRIRRYPLPYVTSNLPKYLFRTAHILILVPPFLLRKYQSLSQPPYITVIPYDSQVESYKYLHTQNTFIILVTTLQQYHNYKMHAKISPTCTLLVDTDHELPQDELYLFRIWIYTMYYGPQGQEYLRKILQREPSGPLHDKYKYLFYSINQEDIVFQPQYEDYEKIFYKDYPQLFHYLVSIFKHKSNWLIKQSPGRPQIIPLNPVVYLENKPYMTDFKNDFEIRGYLNQQRVPRKSRIILHQFSDLPQVYYRDDRQLLRHLQKQQAPSAILYDLSYQAKINMIRHKHPKHKFIGLTDNSERWIDADGILLDVQDYRLRKKQDVFANMFNKDVFDAWNDMRYFYLSNKANLDKARNIYFRTKEQLLQIYQAQPNLLMVVFAQAKDINHVPQAIMAEAIEPSGRVKLILLDLDFIDDETRLFIKFNEIDPVIKHINDVENAGRIDFMVYHEGEGQRTVQTLIQRKRLSKLDDRVYQTMEEVEDIAVEIKGKYKKVYVVCFQDEQQEIQNIFKKYAICNKGIPNEGVQFHFIDRKSYIVPTSSRLQPGASHLQAGASHLHQNSQINGKIVSSNTLPISANSRISINSSVPHDDVSIKVEVRRKSIQRPQGGQEIVMTRKEVYSSRPEVGELQEEEELDYGVPSMDSNIKPNNKLQNMLNNKNYALSIDQKLKSLFPVGKFFTNRATFFSHPSSLPKPSPSSSAQQLIVSTQLTPAIIQLSEDPNKFVIVVGPSTVNTNNIGNVMMMREEEVPGLIRRMEGGSSSNGYEDEDQLNNIKNIDDFAKVRIVYDKDTDKQSKRRLLAASDKNPKIFPVVYKNVNDIKALMQEPDSLLLLMMKDVPPALTAAVQKQNKTIVKKRKVKMIVPKRSDSDIDGLQTILQEEEMEQQGDSYPFLSDQQVDVYLKMFQNSPQFQRPKITKPSDWQGDRDNSPHHQRYQSQPVDLDNITRLNVHSNIDPGNLLHENQIQKIKQRLTGDLIVLVVDNSKRNQVDQAIKRFNVLVQGYTNSMNLENDIRDRKDNVTISVIDRNMLDKIPAIKKKYPQTAFILQSDNPHDDGIEQYRPYLSGQIKKIADLDKIIGDLYQENQRIRFNAESNRAASRFEMKRTSIVDLSNNQRFSVGLSNQKSKKALLFYKDPDNSHIKKRLGENYANLNFVPYKSVVDFKGLIDRYNNSLSILIANGGDIPQLEEIVSKKKELIYVIRFNPQSELRDNPRVKKLLSTYKKEDLEQFIMDQFAKFSLGFGDDGGSKYKVTKNVQVKKYTQKYEPNTFGTTPRFSRDFVPPKSKESTYSRRYMKSTSVRSKINSRLDTLSPKAPRGSEYYHE